MPNCRKCGGYRVVSTTHGYFGKAVGTTVIAVIITVASWQVKQAHPGDSFYQWAIWIFTILMAVWIISSWRKLFKGKQMTDNECKECGEKWSEDN